MVVVVPVVVPVVLLMVVVVPVAEVTVAVVSVMVVVVRVDVSVVVIHALHSILQTSCSSGPNTEFVQNVPSATKQVAGSCTPLHVDAASIVARTSVCNKTIGTVVPAMLTPSVDTAASTPKSNTAVSAGFSDRRRTKATSVAT
jgi:hypothetical protein